MRVVVAGASGLVGRALVTRLRDRGDEVVRLVRRPAREPDELAWDPETGFLPELALRGADAVVNLGGAPLGARRWTRDYKVAIRDSRVQGTALIARTLSALEDGPRVLVQASAVGWYGDRGEDPLEEGSGRGDGFLADVVAAWEAAATPAVAAGVRVALARTGIVLSREGGALARLLPLVRRGLGGPLGPGTQFWPWITLEDEVTALLHLLDVEVSGPVNLVAPQQSRCVEVVRSLARAVHRPSALRVPSWALRLALGEFAEDLLASQRVVPAALAGSGFRWRHAGLQEAARAVTA